MLCLYALSLLSQASSSQNSNGWIVTILLNSVGLYQLFFKKFCQSTLLKLISNLSDVPEFHELSITTNLQIFQETAFVYSFLILCS